MLPNRIQLYPFSEGLCPAKISLIRGVYSFHQLYPSALVMLPNRIQLYPFSESLPAAEISLIRGVFLFIHLYPSALVLLPNPIRLSPFSESLLPQFYFFDHLYPTCQMAPLIRCLAPHVRTSCLNSAWHH
jgi:hypothetical protein